MSTADITITGRDIYHFILSFILYQLGSKADLLLLLITVVIEQAIKQSHSESTQICRNSDTIIQLCPCRN
jgi:hypothetical protein